MLPPILPLLEQLPSPTTVSREIPEAAESAGMLPGLCLLPMLITAADMWPGPRGCWPQPLGAGQDGGQHVGKPTCLSHWPGGHTDSPMPQLKLARPKGSPGERPGLPKEGPKRRQEWVAGGKEAEQGETPRETDGARLVFCRHGDWEILKTGRQTV